MLTPSSAIIIVIMSIVVLLSTTFILLINSRNKAINERDRARRILDEKELDATIKRKFINAGMSDLRNRMHEKLQQRT